MGEKTGYFSPVNGEPLPVGRRFTPGESARENGRKAAISTNEKKRARKLLREELLDLLAEEITDKSGNTVQTQKAMSIAMIGQALAGNTKAYEIIRDTIGEKPTENLNIVTADFSALDAAFKEANKDAE